MEKVFVSGTEIENFVGVWGMKRPQVTALAADNLTDADKKILYEKILAVSKDVRNFKQSEKNLFGRAKTFRRRRYFSKCDSN